LRRTNASCKAVSLCPRRFFFMYICYLDESGAVEKNSSTSHFVLIGVAIPADKWKEKDSDISKHKKIFDLSEAEIHTGWMLRQYPEQARVPDFDSLSFKDRRRAVQGVRTLNLSRPRTNTKQKSLLINYKKQNRIFT